MTTIEAIPVSNDDRYDFLPRHFGQTTFLMIEAHIYAHLGQLCETYQGGLWNFYDLSNGGGFMAPNTTEILCLANEANASREMVSAEAAGIIACLYTFSALAFRPGLGHLGKHFHWLREFALEHPERAAIFAVID